MLTSLSSSASRTPRPPSPEVDARDLPLAPVVDLAARRPAGEQRPLHITRELLAALGGRWAPRS